MPKNAEKTPVSPRSREYWGKEIEKGIKRFKTFWDEGDTTIDTYRMQKAGGGTVLSEDKYNILYSSTETIRPNLYAQRPNAKVQLRHKDRANPVARTACQLLENCLQYVVEEEDFDDTLENIVEDLLLPGLGQVWVRYDPTFESKKTETGETYDEVIDEDVLIDHVYWQDWLCGVSRGWKTVPWVARRCWMNKDAMTERFGKEIADAIAYKTKESQSRDNLNEDETAEVWEIWDKGSKHAFWWSADYPSLLDFKADPLGLKGFFPCPRPLRAVSNTRTFVPRSLFSQYKSQAKQLDNLTKRIRYLTDALRVAGVYDGSQENLRDLLNPTAGNKMIAVQGWTSFAQNGGIKGSVEWVPIEAVVATLMQAIQAREICKNEIYEITGFSDIIRGQSKASETLGAQNIKQNWAGARLRKMQKEVQRFARDTISLVGEVISEHCSPATFAVYGGIDVPSAEQLQTDPAAMEVFKAFQASVELLKNEKMRCAKIDIETDSTLLADQEQERKDRMDFLGAAGAFLQQAVPALTTMPELGPLLGSMLMFTIRTFPASRVIEEEFEKVQKALENKQPTPPPGAGDAEAKAKSAMDIAGIKAQTDQAKIQAGQQSDQAKIAAESARSQAELALKAQAEQNRHDEKMIELSLKDRELALMEREVAVKEAGVSTDQAKLRTEDEKVDIARDAQETAESVAEHAAGMQEAEHEHTVQEAEANRSLQYDQMEHEAEQNKQDAEESGGIEEEGS